MDFETSSLGSNPDFIALIESSLGIGRRVYDSVYLALAVPWSVAADRRRALRQCTRGWPAGRTGTVGRAARAVQLSAVFTARREVGSRGSVVRLSTRV
jgi:hypothetical protein